MTTYEERGVSPHKPDVKKAVAGLNTNLFPGAFCWVVKDVLTGDPDRALVMHADGAGTKSALAYLLYRETGDAGVFRGIAQDSLAMNINDMIAVGVTGPFVLSNTIGRNAKRIPGAIIEELISGYAEQCEILAAEGIEVLIGGGETADLGDLVRTVVVDTTLVASIKRSSVLDISGLKPGAAIVGLASFGKASYERVPNSGIGTNGFSALRHELLSSYYLEHFPESFAPEISSASYQGRFQLSDRVPGLDLSIADLVLSPTRIYAPVVKRIFETSRKGIFGIVNNSGGGQTKCMSFGRGVHYVKSNPIVPPPVFELIRSESKASVYELARTYNLGCLIEIYCAPEVVDAVIAAAGQFDIYAQQIGEVTASDHLRELTLNIWGETAHWKE